MTTQDIAVSVNPADETIHIGPLTLHFLITREQSAGAVTVFEVIVPAGQRPGGPGAQSRPLRRDRVRSLRRVDMDRERKGDQRRAGRGALHPEGRRSPV